MYINADAITEESPEVTDAESSGEETWNESPQVYDEKIIDHDVYTYESE